MKYFAAVAVVLGGLGALVSAQARSAPAASPAASSPAKPGSAQTSKPAPPSWRQCRVARRPHDRARPIRARPTRRSCRPIASRAIAIAARPAACRWRRSIRPRPRRTPRSAEKIVRKLTAGMMPPVGARRPEPAAMKAFVHGLETRLDRAAALNPNPGLAPVPATHPRRVHASRQGPARSRRRRHRLPAARHQQPRLRQRRRRPELLAHAVRGLPARGQSDQPPGRRRPRCVSHLGDLPDSAVRIADAPRRGHAIRRARRHRRHAHVPRGRHLRLPRDRWCARCRANCSATPRSRWRNARSRWRSW